MKTYESPYPIGQVVYLRCRDEAIRGMITRIQFSPNGLSFSVCWGNASETWHYPMELSTEYVPKFTVVGTAEGDTHA